MTSMYFGLVLNVEHYIFIITLTLLTPQPEDFFGFVSEDITDSVENNELAAEGNGQAIGDGDVYPKRDVISNSDLCT